MKVKLNRQGVHEILCSKEMQAICREQADAILNRVGPGYEVSEYQGKNRVNASVSTATTEARKDNAENNTLLKAVR